MATWSIDVIVWVLALVLQIPSITAFDTQASRDSDQWPQGPFTLLQPTSGCPQSWESGFIHQDTEDTFGANHFSMDIRQYLQGKFERNDIETHYCTYNDSDGPVWPTGTYCIMRHSGQCPQGFREGFIKWDDEDHGNGNRASGTLPDEVNAYSTPGDIKIHYCCRDDCPPEEPIRLPTDFPFVLVRNALKCQLVADMELHEVYIRWDDEDIGNQDAVGGAHPYDDGGETNHQLYFCHYQMGPVVG